MLIRSWPLQASACKRTRRGGTAPAPAPTDPSSLTAGAWVRDIE